ncbi:hypothetical protein ALI144C_17050 [Actinosynnema sp. ALI-1.44]|uniref:enediyne antibiotic chromoprotein n=1 Tax=Actinosynnema sp. ALI-1.44 TaxID=1933779 RepID=UPI00097BB700|nr:enediyne antibiotic chromoprotein [Actinosynnema sp. ALI-1.44]ONI83203.1 hypothetical protein ALI144C_17050 [Actinosynnema sp. ALI-1.44]
MSFISIRKFAAIATIAVGGTLMGMSSASAAVGPGVTINPATGLSDGQTVTVAVTGFNAATNIAALQCANLDGADDVVCASDSAKVQTDGNGAASIPLTVHTTFAAFDQKGNPRGTADCKTAKGGCAIAVVSEDLSQAGGGQISFK